eukprot:CAMPEP_0198259654 /NCGR_PEP_ID=MMETSP1447-20131203/8785_1 /TAXON_ID=420782 /ORGANISM="Chaetoceros dichaeta, Strain CCMP1751" /LENGTH=234 /DNA_ID=CAMNT_0043947091 /DNA_START=54 /DNA_END=758 /DNA_ORIENTATION=-
MKLVLPFIILASSTQAFVPNAIPFLGRKIIVSPLHSTSPDTNNEEAIQDAMRLSKEKGATSKEARVAWDIVEELNASDNSAAFAGNIGDDDCLLGDDWAQPDECNDYVAGVAAIAASQDTRLELNTIIAASEKSIAESVKPVSLSTSSFGADDSAEVTSGLLAALENAKKITAELGITSSEAKLAWEDVEEIASSSTAAATKKALDLDECEVDKIEACEALEELDKVLNLAEKN